MEFQQAITALTHGPHFVAFRPGGAILRLTKAARVVDLRGPKPRNYVGKLTDYLGIDWTVMTVEQFGAMMAEMRAAREAAEQPKLTEPANE
jgi:hypothetical protein